MPPKFGGSGPPLAPISEPLDFNVCNSEESSTFYSEGAEGEDVPSLICRWLKTPPHFTTVRINLKSSTREEAISRINQHLVKNHPSVTYRVFPHESYPDTVIIENPNSTNEMKSLKENRVLYDETRAVVVDSACGLAVLRGEKSIIQIEMPNFY